MEPTISQRVYCANLLDLRFIVLARSDIEAIDPLKSSSTIDC